MRPSPKPAPTFLPALGEGEEERLINVADKPSRPWLRHAIAHAFAAIIGNDALLDLRDNEIKDITSHLRPELLTCDTHLSGGRLNSRAGRR